MRGLLAEEQIFIEPSSGAAFAALIRPEELKKYAKEKGLHGFFFSRSLPKSYVGRSYYAVNKCSDLCCTFYASTL